MLKRSALALAALAAVATPALAGKKDNTVRFAYDQVIENVDPYFNNVRLGVIISQHVWDTLIYRDPVTNAYKPQLATAWRWVDDRALELDLRQGVKFHNGEEFAADDVVYTLNYVSDPANKSTQQQNISWIEKAERLDKFKVLIRAKRNFPAAIEYLAGPIIIHPNEYYAKVGPKGMNEKPVGSGPYKIVENVVGKSVKLERNADYWKGAPKPVPTIEKVEIRMLPDRQTQVAEMLSGRLDLIMNVPVDQAQQLKAAPHLGVVSGGTMRIVFVLFNASYSTPLPALKDVRVRRAIAHAIDKETMAKQLVGEGAKIINALCFPTQLGCTDEGVPRYDYNPAKSKQLLAEAGFKDGLELDFIGYRERPQTEAMVNYVRAGGINVFRRDAPVLGDDVALSPSKSL